MRSNAPASPCWARRMASASVISLDSVCLVRVTIPVGTHPLLGMHPWLLELHLRQILLLGWRRRQLLAARQAAQSYGKPSLLMRTTLFSLERLHPSMVYRKQGWSISSASQANQSSRTVGERWHVRVGA